MNIRNQLEYDSFKRAFLLSPAEKICIALKLSCLVDTLKESMKNIEDLIVLKLKAGGAQDLLDVKELFKAAKTGSLDKKRLQALAKRARVDKKLARFLK